MNIIALGQETVSGIAEMVATHLPRTKEMNAYERVLGDTMPGDATLSPARTTSRRRGASSIRY